MELDRSTLADWVGATGRLIEPLVEVLRRHVMSATKLHADDTPVPVLAPGLGKTKTGRLWTYVRDDRPAGDATPPAVWFAYTPDRKGEHPRAHLSKFTGTLRPMVTRGSSNSTKQDGWRNGLLGACAQEILRSAGRAQVPVAAEALERIGALYAIEKEIRRAHRRNDVRSVTPGAGHCSNSKTVVGRDVG